MNFDWRLFIWLFLSFILATIVGTLTHELGHYLVAEWLGYDAFLHYGSTSYDNSSPEQIGPYSDSFWITMGGPLQTIITGTIGIVLLFANRKSFYRATTLTFWQWVLIFVSLFWLRQTANLFTWVIRFILIGKFSRGLDEIEMAEYLGLPVWTIVSFTAFIGITVLAIVMFKFIPERERVTFMAAGFFGGIAGYILWLKVLGKLILP